MTCSSSKDLACKTITTGVRISMLTFGMVTDNRNSWSWRVRSPPHRLHLESQADLHCWIQKSPWRRKAGRERRWWLRAGVPQSGPAHGSWVGASHLAVSQQAGRNSWEEPDDRLWVWGKCWLPRGRVSCLCLDWGLICHLRYRPALS